ncbi:MAG: transcriptional repressor [Ruminococcus sp.]|nr:transcriptional repressor [Ruminococcus sp.]
MAKYKTAAHEQLMRFLEKNCSRALTVSEIVEEMKNDPECPKAPSESTAYRLIKELVAEGRVKRTVNGIGREFVYQLTDNADCADHLHMKCRVCGELLHMDHKSSEKLAESLLEDEGFTLDTGMVLTGVCGKCSQSKE